MSLKTLSQNRINFNDTGKLNTDGLVLYLDAGNISSYSGSGTTWTDLSGNSNNGTLTNGPTFNSSNGGSISFDGTNDYININNSNSLLCASQGTVNIWFKYNSISVNGNSVISKIDSVQSNNGYNIFLYNNTVFGEIKVSGTAYGGASVSVSSGIWYNFTITYSSNGFICGYLNGIKRGTNNLPSFTMSTQALKLAAANDTYWGYFNGNISNAQIYNKILSDTDILKNYNTFRNRF